MRSDEYSTPQDLYQRLDQEFHFTLDPCASDQNHKCDRYFTISEDGLRQPWDGHIVFCNPPYSKITEWVRKCYQEGTKPNACVVMLVPAKTETRWFHNYVLHRSEIRFINGRLHFNNSVMNAPFPSMVVIFRGPVEKTVRKKVRYEQVTFNFEGGDNHV